jgi:hypothetical protein
MWAVDGRLITVLYGVFAALRDRPLTFDGLSVFLSSTM